MALTPEDVRWVAELASLELGPGELDEVTRQLNAILAHVEQLEVGDGGTGMTGEAGAPLREDEPGADALAAGLETIAPAWESGLFTVPRLLSHEDGDAVEPTADARVEES